VGCEQTGGGEVTYQQDAIDADATYAALRRRPGDTWWCGTDCLRCSETTADGSRLEELVATYDPELGVSLCPDCGAIVAWERAPWLHDDPRCIRCRCPDECAAYGAEENCPPTTGDDSI